jgi:poly(hydroxyalkanoate) granule-associated protein
MTEATATMSTTDQIAAAADDASATMTRGGRRLWLAGLGVLAVAAEEARAVFETLEHKGEEFEPSVTAPFRRAGEAVNRVAERAGASVKSVGNVVSNATTTMAGVGRRFAIADVAEEVQRVIDEKLPAALERLDLPTKKDLQALADRIEELTAKPKRPHDTHAE